VAPLKKGLTNAIDRAEKEKRRRLRELRDRLDLAAGREPDRDQQHEHEQQKQDGRQAASEEPAGSRGAPRVPAVAAPEEIRAVGLLGTRSILGASPSACGGPSVEHPVDVATRMAVP
jgi:hypothetical protein